MNSFTFILPVRIDNNDRLHNLNVCLKYLNTYFPQCEIIVVENNSSKKCDNLQYTYPHKYFFIPNKHSFCKSETINFGLLKSNRPYVAIWDIDCLILPNLIEISYKMLSTRKVHVILPHNELFVNIKGVLKQRISDTLRLDEVPRFKRLPKKNVHPDIDVYPIPSGVVLFNKNSLLKIGGYNKKMTSYGWEDIEILKRAKKLGLYYFSFSNGNIIHLDHERGNDSKINPQYEINKVEFKNILRLPRKKLISYVNEELSLNGHYLDKAFIQAVQINNLKNFSLLKFLINRVITKLKTHPIM